MFLNVSIPWKKNLTDKSTNIECLLSLHKSETEMMIMFSSMILECWYESRLNIKPYVREWHGQRHKLT